MKPMRSGGVDVFVAAKGKCMTDHQVWPDSLLEIAREERHRMLSLVSLGLTPTQAYGLLTDENIGAAQTNTDPTVGLVDASDRIEGGNVILWWNDIEKDSRSVLPVL